MTSNWHQLRELGLPESLPADVQARQHRWLLDCIRRNAMTRYGEKYHFENIKTVDDYRDQVPLIRYEDISSYIAQIAQGEADVLFQGQAIAFERTSGSSSKEKLIPYSGNSLQDFRKAVLPWLVNIAQQYDMTSGAVYWAISPATRQPEYTAGGIPIGMPDAAYLGEDILPFFANTSAVPHWVAGISEVQEWQRVTLYYLLRQHDLVMVSVWSPTFLVLLIEAIKQRQDELLALLTQGGECCGYELPADDDACNRLSEYLANGDSRVLWPQLKVISCWADAASKPFFETLQTCFPAVAFQAKGLLSTEGVVTVPDQDNKPLLATESAFFEFLDEHGQSRLAHELITGQRYEVVMTTSGGLYRYRTGDYIICEGEQSGIPVLRFIGRGDLTSDLVGEKLTEAFVCSCLEDIRGFRMLIPALYEQAGYLLVLDKKEHSEPDRLVALVESRLLENPHYAYARKLGQFAALKPLLLDNPLDTYINSPAHAGTRLGDIKTPALCTKTGWLDAKLESVA